MGFDDGASRRFSRSTRGRVLAVSIATVLYVALCVFLVQRQRLQATKAADERNSFSMYRVDKQLQRTSQPTRRAVHVTANPPPFQSQWQPTGESRLGPFTFRCLGNSKYLSISTRGHIRPAAHDVTHARAHWYLVPVRDSYGNVSMALEPALGDGAMVSLQPPDQLPEEGEWRPREDKVLYRRAPPPRARRCMHTSHFSRPIHAPRSRSSIHLSSSSRDLGR